MRDVAHLERVHLLRYEDLMNDPEYRLAALAEFLELSVPLTTPPLDHGIQGRYYERWE